MLRFRTFITETVRQGLPHIHSMDHKQFSDLIRGGKVHVRKATEKTDGMTHVMGHDEHGFYTQSSGSGAEKMRRPSDFHERAKRRAAETGKPYDSTAADAFAHVHKVLASNKGLVQHLRDVYKKTGQEAKIRGEVFYKPMGKPSESHPDEIQFVGTSYHPSHMGHVGKYVVHTELPDNKHIEDPHEFVGKHSKDDINFDHDKIEHEPGHVDVSPEHKAFNRLNHELINTRTKPSNKTEKMAELEKMSRIQKSVASKVDAHVRAAGMKPKWGSGTEGVVVHPSDQNPHAPRFKVTSHAFREYRADPNKPDFKKKG
jgi:hypothetical protein